MAEEVSNEQGNTEQASTEASTQTTQEATETVEATEIAPAVEETATQEQPAPEESSKDDDSLGLLSKVETKKEEGAPESYTDFEFPEGAEIQESDMAALKELAKTQNLTQTEAQKSIMFSRSIVEQIAQEEAKALTEWKATNKTEWEAHPDSDRRTVQAMDAINKLGLKDYFVEHGYVHDAKLLSAFAELGKLGGEDSFVTGVDTAPKGDDVLYSNSPELYK